MNKLIKNIKKNLSPSALVAIFSFGNLVGAGVAGSFYLFRYDERFSFGMHLLLFFAMWFVIWGIISLILCGFEWSDKD